MASETFIKQHPERLKAVLVAHDKAWQWIVAHHDEAIALGAKIQGISHEEAEQLFAWSYSTQRLTSADIESMEKDMAFLMSNGMMRKAVVVPSLVNPEALQ